MLFHRDAQVTMEGVEAVLQGCVSLDFFEVRACRHIPPVEAPEASDHAQGRSTREHSHALALGLIHQLIVFNSHSVNLTPLPVFPNWRF
jgi:hypothetical protein